MRRTMLIPTALTVLLAGCASTPATTAAGPHHAEHASCTQQQALRLVRASDAGSSTPASGYRLVGGDSRDGWVFRHTFGFDVYVGPHCDPWFPIAVGVATQRVRSVRYVDHRFILVGVGNGSDASGAPMVAPYQMVVDPATGLETIGYSRMPTRDGGVFVQPLYPDEPPLTIRSLSVAATPDGYRIAFSTNLPRRATFLLTAEMLYRSDGSPTSTFQIGIQGARLKRVSVAHGLPVVVTVSRGLPSPDATSIYSEGYWRSLPSRTPAGPPPGANAYTVELKGIEPSWTFATAEDGGVLTITITR